MRTVLALAALLAALTALELPAEARPPKPQPKLTPIAGGAVNSGQFTVRAARSAGGSHCAVVTRARRPWQRACSRLSPRSPFSLSVTGDGAHTVVYGIAGRRVRRVELLGPHARPVAMARRGRAFLAVVRGQVRAQELPVRVTLRGGRRQTVDWGARRETSFVDPVSGLPWRASAGERRGGERDGQTCVQFLPHDHSMQGPHNLVGDVVCGDLRSTAAAFKTLAFAGRSVRGEVRTRRTVVAGVAGPQVAAVDVVSPAGTVRAPMSAQGRAFLVVLPAETPVDAVRVLVTLRDGRQTTYAGSFGAL